MVEYWVHAFGCLLRVWMSVDGYGEVDGDCEVAVCSGDGL